MSMCRLPLPGALQHLDYVEDVSQQLHEYYMRFSAYAAAFVLRQLKLGFAAQRQHATTACAWR